MRSWISFLRVALTLSLALQGFPAWAAVAKVTGEVAAAPVGGMQVHRSAAPTGAGIPALAPAMARPGSEQVSGVVAGLWSSPEGFPEEVFAPPTAAVDPVLSGRPEQALPSPRRSIGRRARIVRGALSIAAGLMLSIAPWLPVQGAPSTRPVLPSPSPAAAAAAPSPTETLQETLRQVGAINAEANRVLNGHPDGGKRLRRFLDPMNDAAARARAARDGGQALSLARKAESLGRQGVHLLKRGAEKDALARGRAESVARSLAAAAGFWAHHPDPRAQEMLAAVRNHLDQARAALREDHADEALDQIEEAREGLSSIRSLADEYRSIYPRVERLLVDAERLKAGVARFVAAHPKARGLKDYTAGTVDAEIALAREEVARGRIRDAESHARRAQLQARSILDDVGVYEERYDLAADILGRAAEFNGRAEEFLRDHAHARGRAAFQVDRDQYESARDKALMKLNVGNVGSALTLARAARDRAWRRLSGAREFEALQGEAARLLLDVERELSTLRGRMEKFLAAAGWLTQYERPFVREAFDLEALRVEIDKARSSLAKGRAELSLQQLRRIQRRLRSALHAVAFFSRRNEELSGLLRQYNEEKRKPMWEDLPTKDEYYSDDYRRIDALARNLQLST